MADLLGRDRLEAWIMSIRIKQRSTDEELNDLLRILLDETDIPNIPGMLTLPYEFFGLFEEIAKHPNSSNDTLNKLLSVMLQLSDESWGEALEDRDRSLISIAKNPNVSIDTVIRMISENLAPYPIDILCEFLKSLPNNKTFLSADSAGVSDIKEKIKNTLLETLNYHLSEAAGSISAPFTPSEDLDELIKRCNDTFEAAFTRKLQYVKENLDKLEAQLTTPRPSPSSVKPKK